MCIICARQTGGRRLIIELVTPLGSNTKNFKGATYTTMRWLRVARTPFRIAKAQESLIITVATPSSFEMLYLGSVAKSSFELLHLRSGSYSCVDGNQPGFFVSSGPV